MPAAVAVVDATGYLRAFERTDDAPFLTVDVAIDKAWSCASFWFPTHVWNDHVTNDPKVSTTGLLAADGGGRRRLSDLGGRHVDRRIGISGGTYQQDQDVCVAALETIGFELPA